MSLWLVEKNQRVIATGKMAEVQAVDCSPIDRGLSPLLIKSRGVIHVGLQTQSSRLTPSGTYPAFSPTGGVRGRQRLVGLSA